MVTADVHYDLNTIELANAAMIMAINKANELRIPLIVAGDLHNSKAAMRAECINAMLSVFKKCNSPPYLIVGNHSRINEKSPEHALNFLKQYAMVIDKPVKQHKLGYLIPYYHDPEELKAYLKTLPKGSQLIMHQGVQGSNSGEYIQDKSAITKEDVASFRVISGHYHTRQTIDLPDMGTWDYLGNPYTLNFGEAEDPRKGFQILNSDGSLYFVPTDLRKHVVVNIEVNQDETIHTTMKYNIENGDIVKVKVKCTREQAVKHTKEVIAKRLNLLQSFKLEYLYDTTTTDVKVNTSSSQPELLDNIINSTNSSDSSKVRLKKLWRELCES